MIVAGVIGSYFLTGLADFDSTDFTPRRTYNIYMHMHGHVTNEGIWERLQSTIVMHARQD